MRQVEGLHEEADATDKAKQSPQGTPEPLKPEEVSPPLVKKARRKEQAKTVPSRRAARGEPIPTAQTASNMIATTKEIAKTKPKAKGKVTPDRKVASVRAAEPKQKVTPKTPAARKVMSEQVAPQPVSNAKAPRISKAVAQIEVATTEVIAVAPEESAPSQAAPIEPTTGQQPSAKTTPRQTRSSQAVSRERASQLYLWIMAGAADDLVTIVRSGLARYQERFRQPAEVVLCHMDDIAILEKANLPVDVRQGKGVPPRNSQVGGFRRH